jgi:putative ABC transport system permease protein
VQDEFSFDAFHKKQANIYKLENRVGTGDSRQLWSFTAAPIGVLAKKEIPGVENVVRMSYNGYYGLFKYSDKVFNEQGNFFTDPSFFSVFDFPMVEGDAADPFPDDHSVVITEFKVSGIVKDFPENSTVRASMLFPMSLLQKNAYAGNKEGKNLENDFNQFSYHTFLLMKPGFSFKGFTDKLRRIHLGVKADDTDIEYLLLPLAKMHLYKSDGSDGGFATVRMFVIIAILILVIACINYVNLSTARSMLRAKEVSLRKIVGAGKGQLFLQFITETTLLFLFATIFSLGLIYVLMPWFNKMSGKEIILSFSDLHIWKIILLSIASTLIISSIYPALLLSSFEPLKALKGKIVARFSDAMFRKVLVVVQFTFSMVLIAGTIIIGNQLSYIRSKQLGYDKDHVVSCNMMHMNKHFDAIKAELMKETAISNVTAASVNIVRYGGHTGNNWWEGKGKGETLMLSPMAVDNNLVSFFKMKIIEGNDFSGSKADSTHFILNETAIKAARIKDPIGKKFKLWETEGTIIGVVKDFHFASMKQKIDPAIFYYKPANYSQIYLKTTGKDASKAIAVLEKEWKKYNAGYTFDYAFLDETFNSLYKSEERTGTLFNIFAAIAIFISCLGLLGLAAYTAQVRTREIGVRKVLGASIPGIIRLLAGDFIKLVLIAIVIATPLSWYVMNKWLEDFAYKINMGWAVFLLSGLLAIVIALFTISFQSIKAAIANPIKSLRTE